MQVPEPMRPEAVEQWERAILAPQPQPYLHALAPRTSVRPGLLPPLGSNERAKSDSPSAFTHVANAVAQALAVSAQKPPDGASRSMVPTCVMRTAMAPPNGGTWVTGSADTAMGSLGVGLGHGDVAVHADPGVGSFGAMAYLGPGATMLESAMGMSRKTGKQGSAAKNCVHPGCTKGAIGKLKLCIAHGGGKRCSVAGCDKAAQGQQPLCKGHGGGRRCKHPGCPRSARDRTDLCIGHGGGKRCIYPGCSTSARSGTPYCSLHDGVQKKRAEAAGAPLGTPL